MIKVLNQYFPGRLFVLLVTENVLILLGIWAALIYHLGGLQADLFTYPVLFGKVLLITVICQVCLYYADIYDLRNISSRLEVLMRVLQALGVAALILAAVFYFFPEMRLGEGIVETSLLAIVAFILVWRILVEWVNRAYGAGERILLVGSGKAVVDLAHEIKARPDLPLTVIGAVAEESADDPLDLPGLERLGTLDRIGEIIQQARPSRIIIALRERRRQLPIDVLLHYRMRGMAIEEASSLYQKLTGRIPVESIHPSSLIFTDGFRQPRFWAWLGRILGLVLAVVLLVLLGPLLLLIALLIKLDSKGPVLYKQARVGLNGREFQVLKFRSMRSDAETASGPVWASENDPRVTRVGRILRQLRLDELPQVINVLKGEMAFVGPRPERPHFVVQLKERIPFYDLRHYVRPGITGWAQVSHHYGASVEDSLEKLEYDLFYIKNISLSFDCLILFQTIKIVLFGRGAR
jgi:sugar transferase (PEP-CTERM system associated)